MTRTWQQTHNSILKRAQLLFAEVMRVQQSMTPESLAKMMYSRKGQEHHTRTLCRYLRGRLSPDVLEATEAIQCHGICGGHLHSWFKIMPDAESLAQEGYEKIQPNWKYIIDPQFPEVIPQILLISPDSPAQYMYEESEAVPCMVSTKNTQTE